jgi:hypothetical protein
LCGHGPAVTLLRINFLSPPPKVKPSIWIRQAMQGLRWIRHVLLYIRNVSKQQVSAVATMEHERGVNVWPHAR